MQRKHFAETDVFRDSHKKILKKFFFFLRKMKSQGYY